MNTQGNKLAGVFVIGSMLVISGAAVNAPKAQAFGLSDIAGAAKKVGGKIKGAAKTVARDIKNTSRIVGRNAKDWGTSVGAAAKDIGRGGKWVGQRVVGGAKLMVDDVKIAGRAIGRGIKRVVPCPYSGPCRLRRNGINRAVTQRARPVTRVRRAVRVRDNRAIPPSRIRGRKPIARDKSVWGRPVGVRRSVGIRRSDLRRRVIRRRVNGRRVESWRNNRRYNSRYGMRKRINSRRSSGRRHRK